MTFRPLIFLLLLTSDEQFGQAERAKEMMNKVNPGTNSVGISGADDSDFSLGGSAQRSDICDHSALFLPDLEIFSLVFFSLVVALEGMVAVFIRVGRCWGLIPSPPMFTVG